jgi:diguanylate cyclase (GGDEF)-like protein/PAS domain S-box-containing protein
MSLSKKIFRSFAAAQWIELAIALFVLGGLIAYNIAREHQRVEAVERDRLATQARVISRNLEFQLKGANQALLGVLEELREQSLLHHKVDTQHLRLLANAMPGIRAISVFDNQGNLISSNYPEFVGQNFSHREYFITVKEYPSREILYISKPFKGLSGRYLINVTRMVPDKAGGFAGIVTATLNPEYFTTLLTSVLYAPDVESSLAHGDGLLFIVEPVREELQGTHSAMAGSLIAEYRKSSLITTLFSDKLHAAQESRMIAQRIVQSGLLKMDKSLDVTVSRDTEAIFESWRHTSLIEIGFFLLFTIFSVSFLYIYQKHQRRYEQLATASALALERSEKLFRSTYDSAAIGMALLNLGGRFIKANQALCNIVGYTEEELCQKTFAEITHPDDLEANRSLMRELVAGACVNYQMEKRYFHKDGRIIWILLTGSATHDSRNEVLYFVVQIQDINEQKALQEKLKTQAFQDYLTGLPNRRHFMEQAAIELARVARYGGELSLLMVDVDNFKKVNDTYGHQTGDRVLQKLGEVSKAILRDVDLIGRIGGEEFAILLPETDGEKAREVAERLRVAIAHESLILEMGVPLQFTVSIGVATIADHAINLDTFLARADTALYHAKTTGRNKISLAH